MIVSNPWVNVLSQTIASEPFIIAGTRLEEPDLEYFLAARTAVTSRKDRGPSFLIEPDVDPGTEVECRRHDLVLYRGTLEDFLRELNSTYPIRPAPVETKQSTSATLFHKPPSAISAAIFAKDFSRVEGVQEVEDADYGFYVGRQPRGKDIALERDVSRQGTGALRDQILKTLSEAILTREILLVEDQAGGGKSTIALRALFEIATSGTLAFQFNQTEALDVDNAAAVFAQIKGPFIIFCDNFADHATVIGSLFRLIARHDFIVVGCERHYRVDHAIMALGGLAVRRYRLPGLRKDEVVSLVGKMEALGLTSGAYKNQRIEDFAAEASSDSIAACVCRILNDFRPMEAIVSSVYEDADDDHAYLLNSGVHRLS